MTLRRRTSAAALVLVLGLAPMSLAVADEAERVDDITQDIQSLGKDVEGLEARYINPELLSRRYEIEERINEGRYYFLLEDYTRSAVVFVGLVEDPRLKGKLARRDALYHLAESLYKNKNYIGSRRYFNELLGSGAGDYRQDSIKRLIEISTELGEHQNIENLYKAVKSRSGGIVQPELVYVYGKSLFFRERYKAALRSFKSIPSSSTAVYPQALYFQGVIFARQGARIQETARKNQADKQKQKELKELAQKRLEKSRGFFEEILTLIPEAPETRDQRELLDLTRMAMARVFYEMGEYERAIDQYQYIGTESPEFDRAHFEMTWSQIKLGNVKEAQRKLETFLLTDPDGALVPEARLLSGDLLLQLQEYGEAVASYQDVIDLYEPLRESLRSVTRNRGGAKAYFDALLGRDVGQARSLEVPPIVASWVNNDPEMRRNLTIAEDLDNSERDISESMEIIGELEDAINSRSKIDIFPEMKEGWGRGLETQFRFIELKKGLVDAEARIVLSDASSSQKETYRTAREERRRLQKVYEQIPKSRENISSRESLVKEQYTELEDVIYRLGYEIDSARAQLIAMDKWIQDVQRQEKGKEGKKSKPKLVRESMDDLFQYIKELEQERQELRRIVRRSKTQTGINDDVAEQEEEVKKEYQAALARERQVLSQMRGAAGGDDRALLGKMDQAHSSILQHEARLQSYFAKLEKNVNRKVVEIRKDLDVERVRIAQYAEELSEYSGSSETLAGDIAKHNFQRVEDKFTDLILKADVGIIDVAWKRKDDRSTRIKKLFETKGRELKTLDQNFEGLLEEGE